MPAFSPFGVSPNQFTPDAIEARRQQAAQQVQQSQLARQQQQRQQRADLQQRIAGDFGTSQAHLRPLPEDPNAALFSGDLSGVDFGSLGRGYTGPARQPGSPNPTGRFDHETPGSGLIFSQLSNEQAARDFHRGALLHGTPGFPGAQSGAFQSGLGAAALGRTPGTGMGVLPNGQRFAEDVDPGVLTLLGRGQPDVGQFFDPESQRLFLDTPQNSNPYIVDALEMGYTIEQLRNMGPAESAQVFDAVIRSREFKNQRPKRGLQVGPFNLSPGLIAGGLFAAPFALAGAGGVGAAGGLTGATTSFLGAHPLLAGAIPGAIAGAGTGSPLGVLTGGAAGAFGAAGGLGRLFQSLPQNVLSAINTGVRALGVSDFVRDNIAPSGTPPTVAPGAIFPNTTQSGAATTQDSVGSNNSMGLFDGLLGFLNQNSPALNVGANVLSQFLQGRQAGNQAEAITNLVNQNANSLAFNPRNVTTGQGTGAFDAQGNAVFQPSPAMQTNVANTGAATSDLFSRFMAFNPEMFAEGLRDPLLEQQENEDLRNFTSSAFNQQGLGTGFNRSFRDSQALLEDRRMQRAIAARQQAEEIRQSLFDQFLRSTAGNDELLRAGLANIEQGGVLGGAASTGAANRANFIASGTSTAQDINRSFLNNLTNTLGSIFR